MKITAGMAAGLATAALLAACKGDAPPPAEASAAASTAAPALASEVGREVEQLTRDMVTAVYTDSGEPVVTVKFDPKSRPQRGEPLDIALVFIPRKSAASLGATFVAAGGLAVAPGQEPAQFSDVEAGAPYPFELQVMPEEDGVHYVSVVTQLAAQSEPLVQTFYIPIIVGSPQ